MKTSVIYLFLISILLLSCDSNNIDPPEDIIGTWSLIEILADNGSGNAAFTKVQSLKNITFQNNGELSSNGNICSMSTSSNNVSNGHYSIIDEKISTIDCNLEVAFNFQNNTLIITYPCIEPCLAKYKKD